MIHVNLTINDDFDTTITIWKKEVEAMQENLSINFEEAKMKVIFEKTELLKEFIFLCNMFQNIPSVHCDLCCNDENSDVKIIERLDLKTDKIAKKLHALLVERDQAQIKKLQENNWKTTIN